jgi:hypothetical protein
MAFRLKDQNTQYRSNAGAILAGGFLYFYENGTSTEKDTYSDPDLAPGHVNANPVDLDSSGRATSDIWLDGVYSVELQDSLGATVWSLDDVQADVSDEQALPVGDNGQFLTTDGANYSFVDISQVPDQTGHAGEYLTTDGETASWTTIDIPELPDLSVDDDATSLTVGDMTIITGASATGSYADRTASKTVTFDTAFASSPVFIGITVTNGPHSAAGNTVTWRVSAKSTTQFTVDFTMVELDDADSQWDFNTNVNFDWQAMGVKV